MAIVKMMVCRNGICGEEEVEIPDEELEAMMNAQNSDEISDYEALAIITGGTSV